MVDSDPMLPSPSVLALLSAAAFFGFDLVKDLRQSSSFLDFGVEFFIFVAVLTALGHEIWKSARLARQVDQNEAQLDRLRGQLAEAVGTQFAAWGLSASESEVAWMILKGFSFREIAEMRSVSEKTARKQAGAVYAKSGTANRSEFTAGFLEDLLNTGSATR